MKRYFSTYGLLWLVYILFLCVLMPHTAWTFSQFQELKTLDPLENPLPWMLAFAVESVIAVFTHKLAEYLTATRRVKGWHVLTRWLNGYVVGLLMVLTISSIANLAYAVQFGGELTVFAAWGIDRSVYEFAFGAMLPFVSLVFALVLSKMSDDETETDPALEEAKRAIKELRETLRESERGRKLAEDRLGAVVDIGKMFISDKKSDRIAAIYQRWPSLPHSAIAQMTESSASHVSEVINGMSKN